MKKKLLSFMLAVVFIIPCVFMSACHSHTFTDAWTYDETGHWHQATCEHENQKSGFAEHALNNDGVCDCGYNQNEYLFQMFKNAKYLPDVTEDYTLNYNSIYHRGEIVEDVEDVDVENYGYIMSYDHSTNSAYYYAGQKTNDVLDYYEIEYVKHDGENFFYCDLEKDEKGEKNYYALGDATYARGISNRANYNSLFQYVEFTRSFDTFASALEDANKYDNDLEIKVNQGGTFSFCITLDEGKSYCTIDFNKQRITSGSLLEDYSNMSNDGVTQEVDECIYSLTITSTYDSVTINNLVIDKEITFKPANELALDETDVCVIIDLEGCDFTEYYYTEDLHQVGEVFSLDHLQSIDELTSRNLKITGLYYDEEHTQPVNIGEYKYGYWIDLYATVGPEDGYALLAYQIDFKISSRYEPCSKNYYLTYDRDTYPTLTLPMNLDELYGAGMTLGGKTPQYPENYKIYLDGVEVNNETKTIELENQRIYNIKVEMLPAEE